MERAKEVLLFSIFLMSLWINLFTALE